MEEIAEVYSRSLFEVAKEHDALDDIHDELGQLADELAESRELPGPPRTIGSGSWQGQLRGNLRMKNKPGEIQSLPKGRIGGLHDGGADKVEGGTVVAIAGGIAGGQGLDNCMSLELLELPHD